MRGNSGIIGSRQTTSSSSASGFFSLIDQQIIRGAGLWPLTSPPSLNSIFFDGTGDYITFSATGDFAKDAFWGSGKTFTVEAWIYPTSLVTQTNYASIILGDGNPTGTEMCWSVGMSDAQKPHFFWYDGAVKSASVSTALTLNIWSHVAWVASAGSVSIYVNGVSQALTGTTTLTNASQTVGMEIGVDRSRTIAGYISNLRAVKGTAIYTSNFTLPIQNLINVANTSLLLGTNNSVTDASTNNRTLTLTGQVAANTTIAPHIPASIYFDGTGDYLSIPASNALSLNADFTIESWIYLTSNPADYQMIVSSSDGNHYLSIRSTQIEIVGLSAPVQISFSSLLTTNTWHHLAATRTGSTVTIWLNGTSLGTSASKTGTLNIGSATSSLSTYVGRWGGSPQYNFPGYMSNLRIVKGTAIYTSNFTPAQTNLTAVSGTSLLIGQYQAFTVDFSGNGLAITKSGDTTYSTSVLPF